MAEYVRSGGYLLIMPDNFNSHMVNPLEPAFPKWIPHSHISHFSHKTLLNTLESIDGLVPIKSISPTLWKVLVRNVVSKVLRIRKKTSEVFDLKKVLGTDIRGVYKLFNLKIISKWFLSGDNFEQ